MPFINLEKLISSDAGIKFITLEAIRQNAEAIYKSDEEGCEYLIRFGYAERLKNGNIRISKKGRAFLDSLSDPYITDEVEALADDLIDLYGKYNKETGVRKMVIDRLAWFMSVVNFKKEIIIDVVSDYILASGDYTMRLDNLIWKQENVYAVNKSLKSSMLFDRIAKKYDVREKFYFEKRNKNEEWLFAVSKLPKVPTSKDDSIYITGSREGDMKGIEQVKMALYKLLKR